MSYRMFGTDFVKEFMPRVGDRDKHYIKKRGVPMSTPNGIGVPKENGFTWDNDRLFVTISDDKDTIKTSIDDTVYKVDKLLRDRGINVFPNGNGGQ